MAVGASAEAVQALVAQFTICFQLDKSGMGVPAMDVIVLVPTPIDRIKRLIALIILPLVNLFPSNSMKEIATNY